jgi:hypothetical protein
MLIDDIVEHAQSILSQNAEVISRLVTKRARFENWMQIEIYKRLLKDARTSNIEIEKAYHANKERCDFWCKVGDLQDWVELKLCVTNYTGPSSPRPITNQIDSIIADIQKLKKIAPSSSRHVFLLAYPFTTDAHANQHWQDHLRRIEKSGAKIALPFAFRIQQPEKAAVIHGYKISVDPASDVQHDY